MRYRKKPVVVEAVLWDGSHASQVAIDAFAGSQAIFSGGALQIRTLEGIMTADQGDYIIKGIKGEFYPCKPDIFQATYEKA